MSDLRFAVRMLAKQEVDHRVERGDFIAAAAGAAYLPARRATRISAAIALHTGE